MKTSKEQVKRDNSQELVTKSNLRKKRDYKLRRLPTTSTSSIVTTTNALVVNSLPTTSMAAYNPHNISYPGTNDTWGPLLPSVTVPTPFYYGMHPMPVVFEPQPMYTQVFAYPYPMMSHILQPPMINPIDIPAEVLEIPENYSYDEQSLSLYDISYTEEIGDSSNVNNYLHTDEQHYKAPGEGIDDPLPSNAIPMKNEEVLVQDPLEHYLSLPRDLFPAARMLKLDPNPMIDEFCKEKNINKQVPWLLDLEFGIPKAPITRPLPIYNVKFNSIHCKNTPDAIHPGFENCSPDFKRILLFYYDSVISSWYRGYTEVNCDNSVENFQSWLHFPMQVLGMCWS